MISFLITNIILKFLIEIFISGFMIFLEAVFFMPPKHQSTKNHQKNQENYSF
jgi:hypothetical protein